MAYDHQVVPDDVTTDDKPEEPAWAMRDPSAWHVVQAINELRDEIRFLTAVLSGKKR